MRLKNDTSVCYTSSLVISLKDVADWQQAEEIDIKLDEIIDCIE
jgi:hypothetical protein